MKSLKKSAKVKPEKVWALEQDGEILFAEGMFWRKPDAVAKGIPACPAKPTCEDCKRIRVIRVLISPL